MGTIYDTPRTWLDEQPPEKVYSSLEKFRASSKYSQYMHDYNNDERFALFMVLVDRRLLRLTGMTAMDMADFPSWDCYEGGMTPAEAAQECLESQDEYGYFFGGE